MHIYACVYAYIFLIKILKKDSLKLKRLHFKFLLRAYTHAYIKIKGLVIFYFYLD
jgi:hypothetical protein